MMLSSKERFVTIEKDCAARQLAMETLARDLQARQQQDDIWRKEHSSIPSDIAALRHENSALKNVQHVNLVESSLDLGVLCSSSFAVWFQKGLPGRGWRPP